MNFNNFNSVKFFKRSWITLYSLKIIGSVGVLVGRIGRKLGL